MKIIKREEFMNMPSGTVFSYYRRCVFNDLMIKASDADSWGNDFLYDDVIGSIQTDGDNDLFNKCEKMESGESLPMDFENTTREGFFDDKQLFAIYEKEDVKQLIKRLEKTLTNPHEKFS